MNKKSLWQEMKEKYDIPLLIICVIFMTVASTLLIVDSYLGRKDVKEAYQYAVDKGDLESAKILAEELAKR